MSSGVDKTVTGLSCSRGRTTGVLGLKVCSTYTEPWSRMACLRGGRPVREHVVTTHVRQVVRRDARPEDDEMTVTLADVAARAQVSPATVSRVLNG
ncbi:LacI family DNA-binding transcriptional regulator, partial [Streptomyces sp. WAC 01325]|uniref:LacI family DNA-binding transcriptional regulator n=1 Tax=Streptomyces sp. WAC 01325 TaxID=2203202 RepID=UPI0021AFE7B2